MKANYHTHIYRCNHATGTVDEMCQEAIKHGLDTLGISDHMPYPKGMIADPRRMVYEDLEDYIKECQTAKEKYKDQLEVLIGLEAEYVPELYEHVKHLREKLDYLVFATHMYKHNGNPANAFFLSKQEQISSYTDMVIDGIKSGLFSVVAHPDLLFCSYKDNFCQEAQKSAEKIAKASVKYDVPLEFNANGLRKGKRKYGDINRYAYPMMEFWEVVAKTSAKVVIGSDAHSVAHLNDEYINKAKSYVEQLGLNVVDKIEIK